MNVSGELRDILTDLETAAILAVLVPPMLLWEFIGGREPRWKK